MDFWRAFEILSKRKWLILASVVVTTLLTLAATRLVGAKWMASVYFTSTSKSTLVTAPAAGGEEEEGGQGGAKGQASSFASLAKSPKVLAAMLEILKVETPPKDLAASIDVKSVGPAVFALQVTDSSPQRAAEMANALAQAFKEQNQQLQSEAAADLVKLLEGQLQRADADLRQARQRLAAYRHRRQIVAKVEDHVGPAITRLEMAIQNRDQAAERLAAARGALTQRVGELSRTPATVQADRPMSESPLIQEAEKKFAEAETTLAELKSRYTDQHVEVRQAQAKRDALYQQLTSAKSRASENALTQPNPAVAEIKRAITELRSQVGGHQAELAALESTIATAQSRIRDYGGVDGEVAALADDVTQKAEVRGNVAARLQNASMQLDAARQQKPINIVGDVNKLNPPVDTTANRTLKLLLLAVLCSLMGTCALVIAFDNLDRRIRTVEEAELALPAPVMAAIPAAVGAVTPELLPRATELLPMSAQSEAFRFLGLQLLSDPSRKVRSIMVLSAKADQGTTSTATNLAITLAQAGQRAILVDGNVRQPGLHKVFETKNDFGLTDLLLDPQGDSVSTALKQTSVPNLYVVTAGSPYDNLWELFCSPALLEVSRRLRDRADFVIFDSPSALAFTDAMSLARVMDGAYLCVRAQEQLSGAEQRLVESLERAGVTILGSVLNDVPASGLESFQTYQRYYPAQSSRDDRPRALPAPHAGGAAYQVPGEGPGAEPSGSPAANPAAVLDPAGSDKPFQGPGADEQQWLELMVSGKTAGPKASNGANGSNGHSSNGTGAHRANGKNGRSHADLFVDTDERGEV